MNALWFMAILAWHTDTEIGQVPQTYPTETACRADLVDMPAAWHGQKVVYVCRSGWVPSQ
jgi:hypothetical protein